MNALFLSGVQRSERCERVAQPTTYTQAEIDADDALILAEDAIQAEPEGPLFWNDDAEHSTLYARGGSVVG